MGAGGVDSKMPAAEQQTLCEVIGPVRSPGKKRGRERQRQGGWQVRAQTQKRLLNRESRLKDSNESTRPPTYLGLEERDAWGRETRESDSLRFNSLTILHNRRDQAR